jgi:hypothetical protein
MFFFPLHRLHGTNVGDHEIFALLARYAAYTVSYLPTFRDKPFVPSSRVK